MSSIVSQPFLLFSVLLIYGVFGSPTPSDFGVVEIIVGLGLLGVVGVSGFASVLKFDTERPVWFGVGQVFLVFGVVVGGIGSVVSGAELTMLLRDLLPFGFLFLPLFFYRYCDDAVFVKAMLYGFLTIGVCFALRSIPALVAVMPFSLDVDGLYYLANSPAVLFAAIWFMGMGVTASAQRLSLISCARAALFLALSVLMIVPMALSLQRASLGLYGVCACVGLVLCFARYPRRLSVVLLLVLGGFALVFDGVGGYVAGVYDALAAKTISVGGNMRVQEWSAVWDEISAQPVSLMFGQGFGAMFSSPAVADIEVNYTHSLLSGILLKLGVAGFLLCGLYIWSLAIVSVQAFRNVSRGAPYLVMAFMAPFVIDVFLYAAHKSLDFGVLLALGVLLLRKKDVKIAA